MVTGKRAHPFRLIPCFSLLYGQLEQPQQPQPQKNGKQQRVLHVSTKTRDVRQAQLVMHVTSVHAHVEQMLQPQQHEQGS